MRGEEGGLHFTLASTMYQSVQGFRPVDRTEASRINEENIEEGGTGGRGARLL